MPRASTAETGPAAVRSRRAGVGIGLGRPRRGLLGRARPAGPGRRRGRGRRRVQLFPRRVRRERPRASGAFGPAQSQH